MIVAIISTALKEGFVLEQERIMRLRWEQEGVLGSLNVTAPLIVLRIERGKEVVITIVIFGEGVKTLLEIIGKEKTNHKYWEIE